MTTIDNLMAMHDKVAHHLMMSVVHGNTYGDKDAIGPAREAFRVALIEALAQPIDASHNLQKVIK